MHYQIQGVWYNMQHFLHNKKVLHHQITICYIKRILNNFLNAYYILSNVIIPLSSFCQSNINICKTLLINIIFFFNLSFLMPPIILSLKFQ